MTGVLLHLVPNQRGLFSELIHLLVGFGIEHRVLGILGKHSNFQAALLVPLRFLDKGVKIKKEGYNSSYVTGLLTASWANSSQVSIRYSQSETWLLVLMNTQQETLRKQIEMKIIDVTLPEKRELKNLLARPLEV